MDQISESLDEPISEPIEPVTSEPAISTQEEGEEPYLLEGVTTYFARGESFTSKAGGFVSLSPAHCRV